MRPSLPVDGRLAELLAEATARPMSDDARERQLVSLAYGNLKLANDAVSRASVEEAVRQSRPKR